MNVQRTKHPVWLAGVALAIAVAVSGCAGGTTATTTPPATTQTPTASRSPLPTPTPSPGPDVKAAIEALTKIGSGTEFEVAGGLIDPDALMVAGVSGTYASTTAGAQWTLKLTLEDESVIEFEGLEFRGERYTRRASEVPWFSDVGNDHGLDLIRALRAIDELSSAGTMTFEGVKTWQFKTGEDAVSIAIPMLTADVVPSGSIEVGIDEDGDLRTISLTQTWKSPSARGDANDVALQLEMRSSGRTIDAPLTPDMVWVRYTSERLGYSIGMPRDVTFREGAGTGGDVFVFGPGEFIAVVREAQPSGTNLEGYIAAFMEASDGGDLVFDGRGTAGIGDCTFPVIGYESEFQGMPVVWRFALALVGDAGFQIAGSVKVENEALLDDFMPVVICTFQAS